MLRQLNKKSMNFTKTKLNLLIDNMLNAAFQSVMKGILASNAEYRKEMNELYMLKKHDLSKISIDYWNSLFALNKKHKDKSFELFSEFFSEGFGIIKQSFDLWTQDKIVDTKDINQSIQNFTESFIDKNKGSESFCEESFDILKNTIEKINNVVEEFKKNADLVVEKYTPKSEQANA